MKKPKDVDDLAERLSEAATAPLMVSEPLAPPVRERPPKAKKPASVSVFLRVPATLYSRLDDEAVSRTKATGKGVTVQQVIVDRLLAGQG
jgi:hypothetical protein